MNNTSEETPEFGQGTAGYLHQTIADVPPVESNTDNQHLSVVIPDKIRLNQQQSEGLSDDTDKDNNITDRSGNLLGINTSSTGNNISTQQLITYGNQGSRMSTTHMNTNNDVQSALNWKWWEMHSEHQFRRIPVAFDRSCFYSSFIHVMDPVRKLRVQDLREQVAAQIDEMKIDDSHLLASTKYRSRTEYCNEIKNGAWAGKLEIRVLTELCHTDIAVVKIVTDDQGQPCDKVIKYYANNQSLPACVYIMYNKRVHHYEPLYLYKKNNPEGYETIFRPHDRPVLDSLLDDFIAKRCPYDDPEPLNAIQASCRAEATQKFVQNGVSITFHDEMSDPQYQTSSDHHEVCVVENAISVETHEFQISKLPGDEQSLFASVIHLFDRSQTIDIKSLRKKVTDHLRTDTEIDDMLLLCNLDCKTREDYCDKVEEGTICDGVPVSHALACLYPHILFCIISKLFVNENNTQLDVNIYVKDISIYTKCIFILDDMTANCHFPLFLHDKMHCKEEKADFKYGVLVKKLLWNFIQKTVNCNEIISGEVDTEYRCASDKSAVESNVNIRQQPSLQTQETNKESINKSRLTDTFVKKTISRKRKIPEDNVSSSSRERPKISSSLVIPSMCTDCIQQSTSCSIPSNNENCTQYQDNCMPYSIEQHFQTDLFDTIDFSMDQTMNREEIGMCSTTSLSNQRMKLEYELIPTFRGRYYSDCISKKDKKKDGTKTKSERLPSYFADIRNKHCLNLLIPETFLCGDLRRVCVEITIITLTINECIYFHPYFKFYVVRNGSEPLTMNPLYIYLGFDTLYEVEDYFKGIKNIPLYLPIIMLKQDELLKEKSMKSFDSLQSNGPADKTIYHKIDTLINKFQLNQLRFGITLWIKNLQNNEYHRRLDRQYISQPSTQDKNFKVSDLNISSE